MQATYRVSNWYVTYNCWMDISLKGMQNAYQDSIWYYLNTYGWTLVSKVYKLGGWGLQLPSPTPNPTKVWAKCISQADFKESLAVFSGNKLFTRAKMTQPYPPTMEGFLYTYNWFARNADCICFTLILQVKSPVGVQQE